MFSLLFLGLNVGTLLLEHYHFTSNAKPLFVLFTVQVAVKNSIDVFYFSVLIPLNVFFVEDGKMGMIVKTF